MSALQHSMQHEQNELFASLTRCLRRFSERHDATAMQVVGAGWPFPLPAHYPPDLLPFFLQHR